jgi:hypothetical protein
MGPLMGWALSSSMMASSLALMERLLPLESRGTRWASPRVGSTLNWMVAWRIHGARSRPLPLSPGDRRWMQVAAVVQPFRIWNARTVSHLGSNKSECQSGRCRTVLEPRGRISVGGFGHWRCRNPDGLKRRNSFGAWESSLTSWSTHRRLASVRALVGRIRRR